MQPIHKRLLSLALPAIVSNVSVPLLGLVDTAIVGHLGSPRYIGAISIGSLIFSVIYWLFGFLRGATSGITSQSLGRGNLKEVVLHFQRSALLALIIATLMIVFQIFIADIAFYIVAPNAEVIELTRSYYNICIWGAPAVLLSTVFSGWFVGMQNTKAAMWVALIQNIINIPLSIFFVWGLHMKVEGVALGTLISQYVGLFVSFVLQKHLFSSLCSFCFLRHEVFKVSPLTHLLVINRDLFLRTLCIIAVTVWFTRAGSIQSSEILAANTLLLQFFYIFSYIMDGFANAGEAICGMQKGQGNRKLFISTVKALFIWGIGISCFFIVLFSWGGFSFLSLLTNDTGLILLASKYLIWIIIMPILAYGAFLWDGIFIGTTSIRPMLITMFLAAACFFVLWWWLTPEWGNHALWLAFDVYLFMRSILQTICFKNILHSL